MKFLFVMLIVAMMVGAPAFAGDPVAKHDWQADMAKVQHLYDDLNKKTNTIEVEKSTLTEAIKIIGRRPDLEGSGYSSWLFSVEGTEVEVDEGNGKSVAIPMTLELRISFDKNNVVTFRDIFLLDRFN